MIIILFRINMVKTMLKISGVVGSSEKRGNNFGPSHSHSPKFLFVCVVKGYVVAPFYVVIA